MNLINMKTGARVSSSSSKHNKVLERYKAEDGNFREASQLEYELAGILFTYGRAVTETVLGSLIKEYDKASRRANR